jgi:hypothetical protein
MGVAGLCHLFPHDLRDPWAGGVAQMVECLPSKHSNPSTKKTKNLQSSLYVSTAIAPAWMLEFSNNLMQFIVN